MSEQWESFTKKYAQAFLNLYNDQLSAAVIGNLVACENFLTTHKNAGAYLSLSSIALEKKTALLKEICASFNLPTAFDKLSHVLLKNGHIEVLPKVLQKIISGNRLQKNIINFTVSLSHALGDQEKKSLVSFIKKNVSQEIMVDFIIDPSLICGIKIKSNTLLWERSIAKQLKTIKLDALQRVQL